MAAAARGEEVPHFLDSTLLAESRFSAGHLFAYTRHERGPFNAATGE